MQLFDNDLLPVVTQEEFNAITCNRCGDCCEAFYQPSPLDIAIDLGKFAKRKQSVDYYGFDALILVYGWSQDDIDDYIDYEKRSRWYSDLEPNDTPSYVYHNEYRQQYKCHRFKRINIDEGLCTAHEDRPNVCRNFPYGKPAGKEFPRCSWRFESDKADDRVALAGFFYERGEPLTDEVLATQEYLRRKALGLMDMSKYAINNDKNMEV